MHASRRAAVCLLVLAGLLVSLVGASSAAAKAPPEGWGAAAMRITIEYWGGRTPTNCARTEVLWDTEPPAWSEGFGLLAAAEVPEEPVTYCRMWMAGGLNVYTLCVFTIHEYGHWLGYGWGLDPRSITYDGDAAGDPWAIPIIKPCAELAHHRNVVLYGSPTS